MVVYVIYYSKNFCVSVIESNDVNLIYSFPRPTERYILMVANQVRLPLVIEMWEDYALFGLEIMTYMKLPKPSIKRQLERVYTWMVEISKGSDIVIVPTTIFREKL